MDGSKEILIQDDHSQPNSLVINNSVVDGFVDIEAPLNQQENDFQSSATERGVEICEKSFIKVYRKLMVLVGWEPIIMHTDHIRVCNKTLPKQVVCVINWVPFVLLMTSVVIGYVIQALSCLDRNSGSYETKWEKTHKSEKINSTNETTITPNEEPSCDTVIISQFIIPDILHLVAYIYSLYVMRQTETENLRVLAERTFTQISQTSRNLATQRRLIRQLRTIPVFVITMIVIALVSQILSIISIHDHIYFFFFHPSQSGKITLQFFILVSFVAFDIVYIAVVVNYCVQCQLIKYFCKALKENVLNKRFDLLDSMQKISEIDSHLNVLNYKTATALSMLLFSFATFIAMGINSLLSKHDLLITVSSLLLVFYWSTVTVMPVVQASRVSSVCNEMRKLGHLIRIKPFFYQNIEDQQLNSFMMFTSSLNMRAKLFFIPVRTSCVCAITVVFMFVMLFLFQLGVMHLWITP